MRAGFKLGSGLLLLVAVLGIRIVMATPEGVEAEVAELERVEMEIAGPEVGAKTAADPVVESGSLVSRLASDVRARLSESGRETPDEERIVSCRLDGGIQFMRAANCATRGGLSTDFD